MELPRLISVDDHVIEPASMFEGRLPSRFVERAPHVERRRIGHITFDGSAPLPVFDDDGLWGDIWIYEDTMVTLRRNIAGVGYPEVEQDNRPITFDEMRPGCYEPRARLADMDMNHTEASLCFPTFARFCGQTFLDAKDKELALLLVRAYNDWMVEEWCGDSGGRLIPLCIIPLWDAQLATDEVRRNAGRGVHAVCFSEIPPHLGLPSIHDVNGYWDPFFAECASSGTTICMHVGSSSRMPATSADAPGAVPITLSFNNSMAALTDWLFSGVLARLPELQIAFSEGQIGWLPYVLERADDVWKRRSWSTDTTILQEPPSTYYYRQVFGCFFRDFHGLRSLSEVGVDNITFETDYPHGDGTWPNTRAVAEEMFSHLNRDEIHKVVRGNAIRMLHLEPSGASTGT